MYVNYMTITLANIFILDWDDTLFPTFWVQSKNINIRESSTYSTYKLYFIELDKQILSFLTILNSIGEIYIVSNAGTGWLNLTISILPSTKEFIENNKIPIMSARDKNVGEEINQWKIKTFKSIFENVMQYVNALNNLNIQEGNKNELIINIISIGDAHYEYIALINLNDFMKNTKLKYFLKNIKLMEKPQFNDVIDQIKALEQNITMFVNKLSFIDVIFNTG